MKKYFFNHLNGTTNLLLLLMVLFFVWNIPHTIAIRYLTTLIILITVFYLKPDWEKLGNFLWLPGLWALYLIIYTFLLADNFQIAFKGFSGEWLKSIIYMLIGFGSGLLLSNAKKQSCLFLAFGIASFFPLLIHIFSFIQYAIASQSIPLGYWGLHKHHADLGYTAIQAITFLTLYLVFFAKELLNKILAGIGISLCLLSPILARSRAGSLFTILTLMINALLIFKFETSKEIFKYRKILLIASILVISSMTIISKNVDSDRWRGVTERLYSGFQGDAIQIICDGPLALQNSLSNPDLIHNEKYKKIVDNLNSGDSYRILTARAGIELMKEFPMGMSGSKDAYAAAIKTKCKTPSIKMDHTHNGWIDTALSIGIPGVMIYFTLMIFFGFFGWANLKSHNKTVKAWAVALFSLTILWSLRSLFDSAQRDQMLEIQSFFLPFAMSCIIGLKSNSNGHNSPQT
jgi:hypothetical protein